MPRGYLKESSHINRLGKKGNKFFLFFSLFIFMFIGEPSHGTEFTGTIPSYHTKADDSCEVIWMKLQKLNQDEENWRQGVAQYLNDVSDLMGKWYKSLQSLEGRTVFIPKNTFQPMSQSAENVAAFAGSVKQDSEQLFTEWSFLLKEIKKCLPPALLKSN